MCVEQRACSFMCAYICVLACVGLYEFSMVVSLKRLIHIHGILISTLLIGSLYILVNTLSHPTKIYKVCKEYDIHAIS